MNFLLNCYLGLGSTVVRPIEQYERKSISCETTFRDLSSLSDIKQKLWKVAQDLESDCKKLNLSGRKISLKIKKHTYESLSRQRPLSKAINSADELYKFGLQMLEKEMPLTLRLIGLRLTDLVDLSYEGPLKTFLKGSNRVLQQAKDSTLIGSVAQDSIQVKSEFSSGLEGGEFEDDLGFMIHSQGDEDDTENIGYRSWSKAHSAANKNNLEVLADHRKRSRSPSSVPPEIPSVGSKQLTSDNSSTTESTEQTIDQVSCPICSNMVSGEALALNKHVDWCLSRGAIREAVQESYAKNEKR